MKNLYYGGYHERFEHRCLFISRWSKLCGSHLQSQNELYHISKFILRVDLKSLAIDCFYTAQ